MNEDIVSSSTVAGLMNDDIGSTGNEDIGNRVARLMNEDIGSTVAGLMNE